MKLIKKLFLLIILIIVVVGVVFYINGNKLYKESIAKTSLSDKVSQIRQAENFTSINDVPACYKDAIVAVEDHRFYIHGTIDPIALARATVSNIKQKNFKEGGSTLTQQTAKNLYFISEDEVINRKIAEVLVGIDLEKNYSKDEILELYFNTIYFGDGYYGIKEACNGYLNKEPKDMTLSDATLLAGIPNAPSVYAPTKNPDLAIKRQKKVISSMVEYGYLSQEEADTIK